MPFQPLVFILARTMAQRQGVSDQEANRLGVVGAVLRPPALGLVAAAAIARRETPAAPQLTRMVEVPDLIDEDSDDAALELKKFNLGMFAFGARGPGPIISQSPPGGTPVPEGTIVNVEIG